MSQLEIGNLSSILGSCVWDFEFGIRKTGQETNKSDLASGNSFHVFRGPEKSKVQKGRYPSNRYERGWLFFTKISDTHRHESTNKQEGLDAFV